MERAGGAPSRCRQQRRLSLYRKRSIARAHPGPQLAADGAGGSSHGNRIDIMTKQVVTGPPDGYGARGAGGRWMSWTRHFAHRRRAPELVGMLSDRDPLRLRRSNETLQRPVSEVMSADVLL